MKQIGSYVFIVCLCQPLSLSAQQVTDFVHEQEGQKIKLSYTLTGSKANYNIQLYVRKKGGDRWDGPLEQVSGDVGHWQRPGSNKTITWDVLAEREKLTGVCVFGIKVTDEIKQVRIGSQSWMPENLNVSKFRNGARIPEAKTNKDWKRAWKSGKPAWCYYDNDASNGEKYGKLYNWHAVNDTRGLAPKGWHVPSDAEWTALTKYLNGKYVAGTKLKSASELWGNTSGTNVSGFSGLPGGCRTNSGGFYDCKSKGNWWCSAEYTTYSAWNRSLNSSNGSVARTDGSKGSGLSVRCIKD